MGLFKSFDNLPKETQKAAIVIPKFTNIDLNIKQINDRIKTSTNLNHNDMVAMIRNSYHIILDDIFLRSAENRESIISVFNQINFINAFTEVIGQVVLSPSQRICCNKLAWDYMTSDDNNAEIKEALMKLSDTVNRTDTQVLSTIIPLKLARYLALARYSSFDEIKNITRANTVLIKASNGLTEQNLIDIYSVIFKTNITLVFQTIMFDHLKEICSNDNEKETYSLISNCILDILENMSTEDINSILSAYVETKNLMNKDSIRFGIRTISETDYPRIYNCVEYLEKMRDIYVP